MPEAKGWRGYTSATLHQCPPLPPLEITRVDISLKDGWEYTWSCVMLNRGLRFLSCAAGVIIIEHSAIGRGGRV